MNMSMGGGIGMLFFVLLWVVLIGLAVWALIAVSRKSGTRAAAPEVALNVLKERYARGEIGKQEFEEKKRDLQA